MSEFMNDIKKTHARIDAKLDDINYIHDELYKAFVVPMGNMLDGAEGEGIKNDFKAKGGDGVGTIPKVAMLDGAEGKDVKNDFKSKAGSGANGKVLEGGAPLVDGAKGAKIEKKK